MVEEDDAINDGEGYGDESQFPWSSLDQPADLTEEDQFEFPRNDFAISIQSSMDDLEMETETSDHDMHNRGGRHETLPIKSEEAEAEPSLKRSKWRAIRTTLNFVSSLSLNIQDILEHPALRIPALERTEEQKTKMFDILATNGCFRNLAFLGADRTSGITLMSKLSFRTYQARSHIYTQGQDPDGVYVLLKGTVVISMKEAFPTFHASATGDDVVDSIEHTICTISGTGEVMGDMDIMEAARTATATAEDTVHVLFFSKTDYLRRHKLDARFKLMRKVNFLKQTPLFARAPKHVVEKCASMIVLKHFPANCTIARKGRDSYGLCIISSGLIAVGQEVSGIPKLADISKSSQRFRDEDFSLRTYLKPALGIGESKTKSEFFRVCLLNPHGHFGIVEATMKKPFEHTYVTTTQTEMYILSKNEAIKLVEQGLLGFTPADLQVNARWRASQIERLQQSIDLMSKGWGNKDLIDALGHRGQTIRSTVRNLTKELWGMPFGDYGLVRVKDVSLNASPNITNAVRGSGYCDPSNEDNVSLDEAVLFSSMRIDPDSILPELDEAGRKIKAPGEVLKPGWRRLPGTNITIPPSTIHVPRLDLDAVARNEAPSIRCIDVRRRGRDSNSIRPVEVALTERQKQLVSSLQTAMQYRRPPDTSRLPSRKSFLESDFLFQNSTKTENSNSQTLTRSRNSSSACEQASDAALKQTPATTSVVLLSGLDRFAEHELWYLFDRFSLLSISKIASNSDSTTIAVLMLPDHQSEPALAHARELGFSCSLLSIQEFEESYVPTEPPSCQRTSLLRNKSVLIEAAKILHREGSALADKSAPAGKTLRPALQGRRRMMMPLRAAEEDTRLSQRTTAPLSARHSPPAFCWDTVLPHIA